MSQTRKTYLDQIDKLGELTGSNRWDKAEKILHLTLAFVSEWGDLLDVIPNFRTATRLATIPASGRIVIGQIQYEPATPAGMSDAQARTLFERPYKILAIEDTNGIQYNPVDPLQAPLDPTRWPSDRFGYVQLHGFDYLGGAFGTGLPETTPIVQNATTGAVSVPTFDFNNYLKTGVEVVQLLPAAATQVRIRVNHVPALPNELPTADDTTYQITFPNGYDLILMYETAASLLDKAEPDVANDYRQRAAVMRSKMHNRLRKSNAAPMEFLPADDYGMWGA